MYIRLAEENDRRQIAELIAEGFERDFSVLTKDSSKVANAMENGIEISRFYVAIEDDRVVGIAAVYDNKKRAMKRDIDTYMKNFGWFGGMVACIDLKREFEKPLHCPDDTCYLQFGAVKKEYRRRGIITAMLHYLLENTNYREHTFDVISINQHAKEGYEKVGFRVYGQAKEPLGFIKGYKFRWFMHYIKE